MKKVFKWILGYIGTITVFTIIFTSISLMGISFVWKEMVDYKDKVITQFNLNNYNYQPSLITEIYSKNGNLLAEVYDENRRYLTYDQIPDTVKKALLSTEDRRFYQHHGMDPMGTIRALVVNFTTGDATRQGASTITQQLSRQLFLTTEKSYERKLKEAIISFELERRYDKNKLLEIYLNEIYFGHQAYGIESAAQIYFGKSVTELSIDEVTLLVGLPQSPSRYDMYQNPEKATKRRLAVLDSMIRDGYITSDEAKTIASTPIKLKSSSQSDKKIATSKKYPYFTDWVIQQLEKQYGDRIYSSGWKIYTTLDDEAQEIAEKVAIEHSKEYSKLYNAKDMGVVTISPKTGELIAMVGGVDYNRNQINMVVKPRQPGSSIKPLVYATGIEKGIISDSSIELDAPINIGGYSPQNYGKGNSGYMTIRDALRISNNVIAVKSAKKIGIQNIVYYLTKMGVTTLKEEDKALGIALGGMTVGISPYEMANSYGVIANGGVLTTPQYISKITDRKGNIVYEPKIESKQVYQKETADLMTDMLVDVVQNGTGSHARIGIPIAGKTGTSSNARDLWFIGYTPSYVTAVWVGNSDNKEITGRPTGGSIAATVWADYMGQYLKGKEVENFSKDYSLQSVKIYLSEVAPPRLAGKFCRDGNYGSYTVKTLNLRSQYVPNETVDCQPANNTELVQDQIKDNVSIEEIAEAGYIKELVGLGYIKQLVDKGYFDKLATSGYIEQLKKAGYKNQLVEKGYIEQEPTVQTPTTPTTNTN